MVVWFGLAVDEFIFSLRSRRWCVIDSIFSTNKGLVIVSLSKGVRCSGWDENAPRHSEIFLVKKGVKLLYFVIGWYQKVR